jgi:hypothetical protein
VTRVVEVFNNACLPDRNLVNTIVNLVVLPYRRSAPSRSVREPLQVKSGNGVLAGRPSVLSMGRFTAWTRGRDGERSLAVMSDRPSSSQIAISCA